MNTKTMLVIIGVGIAALTVSFILFIVFVNVWAATGLVGAFILLGAVAWAVDYFAGRRRKRELA